MLGPSTIGNEAPGASAVDLGGLARPEAVRKIWSSALGACGARYAGRGQLLQGGAGAQGLVDFLVLAQSGAFVGFGPSTYSFFLSEYRTLQGMATARSVLVDGSKIGTGATAVLKHNLDF